jgi:hypothetical protein
MEALTSSGAAIILVQPAAPGGRATWEEMAEPHHAFSVNWVKGQFQENLELSWTNYLGKSTRQKDEQMLSTKMLAPGRKLPQRVPRVYFCGPKHFSWNSPSRNSPPTIGNRAHSFIHKTNRMAGKGSPHSRKVAFFS